MEVAPVGGSHLLPTSPMPPLPVNRTVTDASSVPVVVAAEMSPVVSVECYARHDDGIARAELSAISEIVCPV